MEAPLDGVGHGSVLAGRYRLEDRLHSGTDGDVWRAIDETLERQVSVRVIPRAHPNAADMVDAARRAALVEDPRLARVLDVGESPGVTYIVTEYVQGRSLTEFLRHGQLPAETVRRIVGEAAQALDRAGARGLHHQKLSTGSICIVPDGSVKLLGTAIESAAAGLEQVEAAGASRSDAVGLVSLLYAGLTGRWPGNGDGPLGPAPRVTGRAVSPAELVAGVPGDLDTLCARTLGPYDDGPRTPGEVAAQLAPWAKPAPLTDPQGLTMTGPERPAPPAPRRPESRPVDEPAAAGTATPRDGVPLAVDDVEIVEGVDDEREDDESMDVVHEDLAALPDEYPVDEYPDDRYAGDAEFVDGPPPTAPTDVATLRAAAERRGIDLTAPPGSTPFSEDGPLAQPPLVHAPAFPLPGERDERRQRVTDRGPQAQAWPTPTPVRPAVPDTPPSGMPAVLAATPTRAPSDLPPAGARGPVSRPLGAEPFDDPSARGVRRLAPTPPPSLGGPTLGGPSGWTGAGRDDERLGPFMPPVPVARPPQKQARLALAIIAALVVLGLILSWMALRSVFDADPLTPSSSPSPLGRASVSAPASNAPTGAATSAPLAITAVTALDPQGDNAENDAATRNTIDGEPDTTWRSERYDTPQFGGLAKKGVGLLVDLGAAKTVSQVIIDHQGSAGTLELRSATSARFEGSTLITTTPLNGGRLVVTVAQPVSTRYLVLWFTKVTRQSGGENRLVVSEVSVR